MRRLLFIVLISFSFVACKKDDAPTDPALQEQTFKNVSYGSDASQKMDVYLPANRTTADTKVFIMIHGGAWTTGDKADLDEYIPVFRSRLANYAIFNINYRLTVLPSTNPFPTHENDVKAAVDFIMSKAAEYKFNGSKLAVLGASAGGQLALLQANKNASPKVKALVDMFGPTDMVALYNSSNTITQLGMQSLLAGTPTSNPGLYASSSPINFITAQSPPTLILHGALDPLVPISQSTALKNKLQSMGVVVQMVTYPTEGHSWTGASLTDTYNQVATFLNAYNQ